MAEKIIQHADIHRLLQESSDDGNDCKESDRFLDSDSDLGEENIETNYMSSESEHNMSDDDGDEPDERDEDEEFYIGRDKCTRWRKEGYPKRKMARFVKVPSLKCCSKDLEEEMGSFLKIIDLNMIDEILECTNKHISFLNEKQNYSRDRDCKETTRSEIMAYLGLLYLIGVNKGHHSNVRDLFSNDGTGMEIARAAMSCKRFLFLTTCLQFDERSTREERCATDKLATIRKILDSFLRNCSDCYSLGEFITIGDMIHFQGQFGTKMYILCDSQTLYTFGLEVYCGYQPNGPYAVSNSPMEVVKRLVSPIENSNRNVTTGSFYTSLPLADYLLQENITLVGTLNKNQREIPTAFLPNKKRGIQTTLFGFQPDKILVSHVPSKSEAVILLSTMHEDSSIDSTTNKPKIIADYDATKGAVDIVEKMCATYSVSRITKRWPCAIFFILLNIAGINAQILHMLAKSINSGLSRRIFLKNLALGLMKEHLHFRAKIPTLPSDVSAFLALNYASPMEETPDQPPSKRGTCSACVRERKRSSASMKCSLCERYTCKRHSVTEIYCRDCNMHRMHRRHRLQSKKALTFENN